MLKPRQIEELKTIRRELHSIPEISGFEKNTAAYIREKLLQTKPNGIMDEVGGHGIIAIYDGKKPDNGESVMVRAELDGLAIDEQSDVPHKSESENRMHACGHDGHMAIVVGVARWLKKNRPDKGRVILLFQSAEETGEGARLMLDDSAFQELTIDRGIALHNLPGYKKNTIYIRNKTFALASVGVKISLQGQSSHAAFPEQGVNPTRAISKLIVKLEEMKQRLLKSERFRVLTITYIKVGEPAFGINPGRGEMGVTIRAETDAAIKDLYAEVEQIIKESGKDFDGTIEYEKKEPFAATVNDEEGVDQLRKVAESVDVNVETLENPIAWSEDFGRFREKCPITLFGLGAGEEMPPLHSETYDFEDELISTGVTVFCEWINDRLNE